MSNKVKWATGAAILAFGGAIFVSGCATGAGTVTDTASAPAETTAAVQSPTAAAGGASPQASAAVLSGQRQVTIVRVQAFESGLSLTDDGRLAEVDDDSGRQLFVPTPLGEGRYLIKAYAKASGHPAADEPSCWQVHNAGTKPLTVKPAVCDAKNPDQWFTITAKAAGTYAISNASAFLQYFPSRGLVLEELGDAPLASTFRFVDNGPARTVGG